MTAAIVVLSVALAAAVAALVVAAARERRTLEAKHTAELGADAATDRATGADQRTAVADQQRSAADARADRAGAALEDHRRRRDEKHAQDAVAGAPGGGDAVAAALDRLSDPNRTR